MPNRSVLVADDIENQTDSGRRRSRAMRNVASFLAQRLKIGIDLLYVEDIKNYPAGKLGLFRFLEWHSQHEKRLSEVGGQFTIPVTCSLKSGSPAEQILKTMRSQSSPELVVVGTRGQKGVKRLFIGSVAEEVIRYSKRPVLVIGPIAQELYRDMSDQKQLKLLVPTDLGKNSRAAERYALSLAKRMGARVTLFHCLWDSINAIIVNTAYAGMAAYDLETVIDRSREDAVEAMKRKVSYFQKQGVACGYKVEEKALTSLCAVHQESESGYAFVVMGTHGRNAFLNAFLGSTARETIMHATIPVITVHSVR
jgi:nucleotide-binding universal stress UspA family protein